jgi:hypothetical protein
MASSSRFDAHLDIAAELDVGAAAGHVGGDGDGARLAGLGDDLGFLLVLAGVQHVVRDALLQQLGRAFSDFSIEVVPTSIGWPRIGFLDQPSTMARRTFSARGAVDLVVSSLRATGGWSGSRPRRAVDVGEFLGLGRAVPVMPASFRTGGSSSGR